MNIVGALRDLKVGPHVRREQALYANPPADIAAFQLSRLNEGWASSLARSPWARAQQQRLSLPDRFESWRELADRVPVQTKADLRGDLAVAGAADEPLLWRSTGGTTAEPLRFPAFGFEAQQAGHDLWVGRGRLGVTSMDRLFMIWGHAQMFGAGPRGALIRAKRRLYDAIVGYTRWNAYRMSPDDLVAAGDALLRSRAAYIIGYSCALDRFARANLDRKAHFRALGLKAVIATAEGYPFPDSAEVIAECFGAPAVMEYGSVETGPIAYQRPGAGFDVFWGRHRLETTPDGALLVTSLNARALPLLRYAIGDAIERGDHDGVTAFERVRGRVNDAVVLPGGTPIHSEAFTHILRDLNGVRAYQIVGRPYGGIRVIRYEGEPLSEAARALIADRLAKIDPALRAAPVERVEQLPVSAAGKHRMIVQEP